MLNKVENNGLNFSGRLLPSKELKDAFDYAKEAAYKDDHKYAPAELANTVNYILHETPDTDVFILRNDGHSNSVSLIRNDERVSNFDNFDKRISAFEALRGFMIKEKKSALLERTPAMIERAKVVDKLHELEADYNVKKAALEEKKQDLYDKVGLEGLKMLRNTEKKLDFTL